MVPLGLDEVVPPGCEPTNERLPLRRSKGSARLGEREALDAVVEDFDRNGCAERDVLEGDACQDVGLGGRVATPVRSEKCVPQRDERLLLLLSEPLVGPDGLVEPGSLRPPLLE